jgi:hypothetical protein
MIVDRKYFTARRWSTRVLAQVAPLFAGEVVNVSGWDDRDKEGRSYRDYFSSATSYCRTNYPGHRGLQGNRDELELDLTAELPTELRRGFDVVLNHTTLKHIFDVRTAFKNLCEMSRDVAIVVVPFSQVQHESPDWRDYWRFTPTCLRNLFRENGMTVVFEAESPERNAAIYLLFVGSRNPENHRGRLPRFVPLENAGKWIGASILVSGLEFLAHRARRLLGLKNPHE